MLGCAFFWIILSSTSFFLILSVDLEVRLFFFFSMKSNIIYLKWFKSIEVFGSTRKLMLSKIINRVDGLLSNYCGESDINPSCIQMSLTFDIMTALWKLYKFSRWTSKAERDIWFGSTYIIPICIFMEVGSNLSVLWAETTDTTSYQPNLFED